MPLIILLYFLQAEHVSGTTMPTIRRPTKRQRTAHRTHTTKNHNFTLTLPPPSLQNAKTNAVINTIVASS